MPRDERGNKWACVSCINGHRATTCDHFDRWMVAVKSAGRPSKRCVHPDKTHCDCDGLRMVLMVAIPNTKPCDCKHGQHECLRGEQFYMTRVANKEVTPHIDPGILDQRLALSEANRVAGHNIKDDVPSNNPSPATSNQSQVGISTAAHQLLASPSTNGHTSVGHMNGLSTQSPPSLVSGNGYQTQASFSPPTPGLYNIPTSLATIENPMTQDQYFQMQATNPDWQRQNIGEETLKHTCTCPDDRCNCSACPSHPFNSNMNNTVWNLANSQAQEMSKLAVSNGGHTHPEGSFQYQIPTAINGSSSIATHPVSAVNGFQHNPGTSPPFIANPLQENGSWTLVPGNIPTETMDSSAYMFYEYEPNVGQEHPEILQNCHSDGGSCCWNGNMAQTPLN